MRAALAMQQRLAEAVKSARLPFDLMVYRGVRSVRSTFRVDEAVEAVGRSYVQQGFFATSVVREVAIEEFTSPSGALLEVSLERGTPALWVAGVGARRLRRQGELLLIDHLQIRVCGHRVDGGLAVLSIEMIRP